MTRPDGLIRTPDGDLIPEPDEPRHHCERGFIGEDEAGRPIPCPHCKADLAERLRALRQRIDGETQ